MMCGADWSNQSSPLDLFGSSQEAGLSCSPLGA